MSPLLQLSAAEITAARLRRMARDLILEAEALEGTVKHRNKVRRQRAGTWLNPITGKVEKFKKVEI